MWIWHTQSAVRVPDVAYSTPRSTYYAADACVFLSNTSFLQSPCYFQWFTELKMKERVTAHAVPETVKKRGTVLVQRITGFYTGFTRLRQGQTDPQSAVWSHFGGIYQHINRPRTRPLVWMIVWSCWLWHSLSGKRYKKNGKTRSFKSFPSKCYPTLSVCSMTSFNAGCSLVLYYITAMSNS